MDDLELSAAVIECLACCRRTTVPLRTIAEFVQLLQYWRNWPPDAAEEIGRRAQQAARRRAAMVLNY